MLEKLLPFRRSSYSKVGPEDNESLLSEQSSTEPKKLTLSRKAQPYTKVGLLCIVIITNTFFFFLGAILRATWMMPNPAELCNLCESAYSPVTKDAPMTYSNVQFNGSFMHENIFRRPASPEVDAAWSSLGIDYRPARVPKHRAQESGLTISHVHIQTKYGGGFPANVEGLHHLHCLNLLRRALYYNYDYYHQKGDGAFRNSDEVVQLHVSHCLDILRQQLMCKVDTGVLGQVWWDRKAPKAFVDFNTEHRCKDFESVRAWAEANQLPPDEELPEDYLVPPEKGAIIYEEIP